MLNKAILIGRLVRDPELKITASQVSVCNFTLAVDRRFKNSAGERQADFIPVIAWRQQGEFAAKYFRKGSKMVVVGSIQTRNWEDADGKRHYATEVIADEIEFGESKKQDEPGGYDQPGPDPNVMAAMGGQGSGAGILPDDDTSLPFEL